MSENSPIHPTSVIRCRWLFIIALLAGLQVSPFYQILPKTLSAFEIPGSLFIGPNLIVGLNTALDGDLDGDLAGDLDGDLAGDLDEDQMYLGSVVEELMEPTDNSPMRSEESQKIDTKPSLSSFKGKNGEHLYVSIIIPVANRHKVDPAIVMAMIMAESGYNPRAVSKKGAKGLMQLMPRTAKSLGVVDSFNPEHNINAGVKYFKQLLNQFNGDVKLALAAYNAGSRKVRKYKGVPPYRATKNYIKKVFKYHQYYKSQIFEKG